MVQAIQLPPEGDLAALGFTVHRYGEGGLALQREPFRVQWFLTQLVTFVFLIPRQVTSWGEMMADYDDLAAFAAQRKKTLLPRGFQCGLALLPIYVGHGFSDELKETVRTQSKKRWCMFHTPSLLDLAIGDCTALAPKYIWGAVYRGYINETVQSVSKVALRSAPES